MSNFKILTLAAAALALSACTSDKLEASYQGTTNTNSETPDNAIQFGTYMGRTGVTRAGATDAMTNDKLKTEGFGVFAYYTGAKTYGQQQRTTYSGETGSATNIAPNFMYNQKVSSSDNGATWTYSPIKYWPNEVGTLVDDQNNDTSNDPASSKNEKGGNVSFFAYAPYVTLSQTDLTDGGIIAVNESKKLSETDKGNQKKGDPTITYKLGTGSNVDLLWGTLDASTTGSNVLGTNNNGVTGSSTASENTYEKAILNGATVAADLTKQKVEGKVAFLFKHALAKVGGSSTATGINPNGLLVKLDIDKDGSETGGVRETFTESSTEYWRTIVTIKSITITNDINADSNIDENEKIEGQAVLNLATGQWLDDKQKIFDKIEQKIVTTPSTGESGLADNLKEESPTENNELSFFAKATGSNPEKGVTETAQNVFKSETAPLVFIPGTTPAFRFTIDYVVRTYDANLSKKYSEVEQVISKKITFTEPVQMNKHYSILMHLGLTGVKFTAFVADWDENASAPNYPEGDANIHVEDIYLPINVQDESTEVTVAAGSNASVAIASNTATYTIYTTGFSGTLTTKVYTDAAFNNEASGISSSPSSGTITINNISANSTVNNIVYYIKITDTSSPANVSIVKLTQHAQALTIANPTISSGSNSVSLEVTSPSTNLATETITVTAKKDGNDFTGFTVGNISYSENKTTIPLTLTTAAQSGEKYTFFVQINDAKGSTEEVDVSTTTP